MGTIGTPEARLFLIEYVARVEGMEERLNVLSALTKRRESNQDPRVAAVITNQLPNFLRVEAAGPDSRYLRTATGIARWTGYPALLPRLRSLQSELRRFAKSPPANWEGFQGPYEDQWVGVMAKIAKEVDESLAEISNVADGNLP